MKGQEIQANEITIFRATAKSKVARVVAPFDLKHQINEIIDNVTLPLYAVLQCGTGRAKWNVYINRVISAIASNLGDNADCIRIMARIRDILEN